MDTFPSSPPAAVRADLVALRAALDDSGIPPKSLDRNVLVATWISAASARCSTRGTRRRRLSVPACALWTNKK